MISELMSEAIDVALNFWVCVVGPTEERLCPCSAVITLSTVRFYSLQTKRGHCLLLPLSATFLDNYINVDTDLIHTLLK